MQRYTISNWRQLLLYVVLVVAVVVCKPNQKPKSKSMVAKAPPVDDPQEMRGRTEGRKRICLQNLSRHKYLNTCNCNTNEKRKRKRSRRQTWNKFRNVAERKMPQVNRGNTKGGGGERERTGNGNGIVNCGTAAGCFSSFPIDGFGGKYSKNSRRKTAAWDESKV